MTTLLQAVMAATLASNGVADPPPTPLAERFEVLGVEVCVGAIDDGRPCDLRLLAPKASTPASPRSAASGEGTPQAAAAQASTPTPAPTAQTTQATTTTTAHHDRAAPAGSAGLQPFEISLLGRTVCLGHPSGAAGCDVTLFPTRAEVTG